MGGVLLNKVLSIVLILTILIIPFQTLLNVKAEGVVITTDETTLEENSGFKHVTNTTNLEVSGTASNFKDTVQSFSAYKILDIYYNETTNEMTYGFTSEFKSFIDQLPSNDDFYNLTIEGYQALTSDRSDNTANSYGVTTTSTLNKLVSKYATYLKKTTNSATSVVLLTKQTYDDSYIYKCNLEVGSYLVLPTEVVSQMINEDGMVRLYMYTFGVSVGNINFSTSGGEWELSGRHAINIKQVDSELGGVLFNENSSDINNGLVEFQFNQDIVYSAARELFYYPFWNHFNYSIPTNTHSSILNNSAIMEKLRKIEYILPNGLTLDKIGSGDQAFFGETIIRDGKLYLIENDVEKLFSNIVNDTTNNKIILSNISEEYTGNSGLIFKLKANNNIKMGTTTNADLLANYGNVITINAYHLKDAYVDISGMTQEEAEAKVLGVGTLTNTVYTYGVKVTNKDNSTLLNGAKFQVCLDENCNTKVGEEFEITENGTYTFKGLNDTDTYYLKQTKASTGYKMASTITLSPTSLNKETGYYDVEVTSAKMGLLPTTGGLGTILYTTFGLLIIVVGSITFISYRKRQVNVNN